jgi:hypothetical protein
MERLKRQMLTLVALLLTTVAQAEFKNLKVTVTVEEAGALFVAIQGQIEEIGELTDVGELTVNGPLNIEDYNVINNQLTNLKTIDLSGQTNAEEELHLHSASVKTIILPSAMKRIPEYAFQDCRGLESIDLPQTVTEIGAYIFERCSALKRVGLPDLVTEIPVNAFLGCTSLTQVSIPSKLKVIRDAAFQGTRLKSFTLPEGVSLNGEGIFASCDSLEEFTFPDGLKDASQVGSVTFEYCYELKKVRLPNDLEEIPVKFFKNTALESIELPATLTKIGEAAFAGVSSPLHIVIPDKVTEIGIAAFSGSSVEEVVWPSGCTTIPGDAFRCCYNLKKITIPETVNLMEDGFNFSECSSLTSIHLPDAITSISYGAFGGCINLAEANIPAACTYINSWAFNNCNLSQVNLPDAVTYIGQNAFSSNQIRELRLPSQVKNIGPSAFSGNKYKSVTVPEGCISIGHNAFGSDSLKTADFPSTLQYMENLPLGFRWYDDNKMESITIRALVPPTIAGALLSPGNEWSSGENGIVTLYVPAASVDLYSKNNKYIAKDIVAITGQQPDNNLLVISDRVTITPACGLHTKKYDVSFFHNERNYEQLGYMGSDYYDHPRLMILSGAEMNIGTLTMTCDRREHHDRTDYSWDSFINRGTCTADKIDLRWFLRNMDYYCPPFDIRYIDIQPEREGAPFAFYRYDPTARAVGNFDKTWVKVQPNEILKAGIGYLFRGEEMIVDERNWQGSHYTEWVAQHHVSYQGGNNYFITNDDVTLPMTHAAGEFEHNKNWNLVGQPYPAFLDIRGIDYDGPILLPKGSGSWEDRWLAYSPLDDEMVLEPMQAFFVQVPDGTDAITLKAVYRQFSSISYYSSSTNNSRQVIRRADKNSKRMVYNVSLSRCSEGSDSLEPARTRFVINPEATLRYDIDRDAPAMASEGTTLLYSQADGVAYAINERPLDNGLVRLGMQIAEPGSYTISLSTKQGTMLNSTSEVWLIDNAEHTRTLLLNTDGTPAEPYTFTAAEQGIIGNRFVIAIGDADPTAITDVKEAKPQNAGGLFNLAGQRISNPRHGLYIENGKKIIK